MSDDEKKLELAKNWKAFEALINSPDYPKDSSYVKVSEVKIVNALKRGGYEWNEDKTAIIAGNFNKSMYKDLTFNIFFDKVNKVKSGNVKSNPTSTSTLIPKDKITAFVAKARADLAKWIAPPSIRESEGEKIAQLEKMLSDAEKLEGVEFEAKEARAIGLHLEKKWKEEEKKKKEQKPKKQDFDKRLKEITRQKFKLGKLDQNKLESQLKLEKGDKVFHLDDLLSKFPKLKDEDKIKETRQDIEFLLSNAEKIIKKAKPVQRAFSPDHFDKEGEEDEEEEEEEEEDENDESDDDDSDASYEKRAPLKKREREEESIKSILAIAIDAKREQRQKLFELCDKKEEFKAYLKTFGSKKRYRTIMCVDGKEVPGFMNGPDLFNTRYEAEEKVKFVENEMSGGNKNVKVIIREEEEEK